MIDGGLRGLFSKHLVGWHCQAIETGGTGLGIPDLNYCRSGVEGWIEMKQTEALAVDISPNQVAWAERRLRAGGRVFLAVRRTTTAGPRKGPATDALLLFPGAVMRAIHLGGIMAAEPLLRCEGPPSKWDWQAVMGYLLADQK